MNNKRIPIVILVFALIAGFIASGFYISPAQAFDKNPELTALKENLAENGLLYITEDNSVPSTNITDFNKQEITTNIIKFHKSDIGKVDAKKYRNIVIDAYMLNDQEVKNNLRESLKQGARITIKKDNITIEEAYELLGLTSPIQKVQEKDNKLTTVGISLFKDSMGMDNIRILSIEVNNFSEALRLIIVSSQDEMAVPEAVNNIIQTKSAEAYLSQNWNRIATTTYNDQWTAVNVQTAYSIYKNPNNPYNGYYDGMCDTSLTVTPRSGYAQGKTYSKHISNSSGTVAYYAPTPVTTTSVSMSFGYPPTVSLSYSMGVNTNISLNAGGPAYNYTQWRFNPVAANGTTLPTTNQTFYQTTDQYYQSGSYFSFGQNYYIDTYVYESWNGSYVYYGAAQSSTRYLSGS